MNTVRDLIPLRDAFMERYAASRFGLVSVGIGRDGDQRCLSVVTTKDPGKLPLTFNGVRVRSRKGGRARLMVKMTQVSN